MTLTIAMNVINDVVKKFRTDTELSEESVNEAWKIIKKWISHAQYDFFSEGRDDYARTKTLT